MIATLGNGEKELLFSIEDNCIYLHVNDTLIIPFKDMNEWKQFANNMLAMAPEIEGNIETRNY